MFDRALDGFKDLPLGRKQVLSLIVCELVPILGLGLGTMQLPTGSAVAELIGPRLPVSLEVGGTSAQVLYAGTAPGQVGVWQVNARLAGGVSAGQLK